MTAAEIKRTVHTGDVFDVTNHYITRENHPCYGTNRRTVLAVNGSSFTLSNERGPQPSRVPWPKARGIELAPDGAILIYDHPKQGDLFLTLRRVSEVTPS